MSTEAPTAETTVPVTPAPEVKPQPTEAQVRYEARLEELAKADRAVKAEAREAAALKQKYARYEGIDERLGKGEIGPVLRQLLADKYNPDLLVTLADDLAPRERPVQEVVDEALSRKDRERAQAAEAERTQAAVASQAAADAEVATFMKRSADYLKGNAGKYPLIAAWDVPMDRYNALLLEHIEKHNTIPEPEVLFPLIEEEHRARARKAGLLREEREVSLEEHVAAGRERGRAPSVVAPPMSAAGKSGYDIALENLDRYDREQRERLRYRP